MSENYKKYEELLKKMEKFFKVYKTICIAYEYKGKGKSL